MENTQNPEGQNNLQSTQPSMPDYSFIEQQPGPVFPQKRNNKLIVGIVVLVVLVLVGGVGLVLGTAKKNTDTNTVANNSEVPTVDAQFVQYVREGNVGDAYLLLAPLLKQQFPTQDRFEQLLFNPAKELLASTDCQVTTTGGPQNKDSLVYKCTKGTGQYWTGLGILNRNKADEQLYKVCSITTEEIKSCL